MNKRSFLRAMVAAPFAAKVKVNPAQVADARGLAVPSFGDWNSSIGSVGSGMTTLPSSSREDLAKRLSDFVAGKAMRLEEERRNRRMPPPRDPDLIVNKSMSLFMKAWIQRERDIEQSFREEKSWFEKRIAEWVP